MMSTLATQMTTYGVLALLLLGVALVWISAIGLLRMPDLYLRASVSSKGVTLGIAALMLAVAFHFGQPGISSRAIAIAIFMMITAPVAAHMVGRAAYRSRVPFVEGTNVDDDASDVILTDEEQSDVPMKGGESWAVNSPMNIR